MAMDTMDCVLYKEARRSPLVNQTTYRHDENKEL